MTVLLGGRMPSLVFRFQSYCLYLSPFARFCFLASFAPHWKVECALEYMLRTLVQK